VTKDVRYSACSPVKGPSFLHTAGVNDGWLFNQRGSTVRVSRTATPCMVYPPVVRYSPTRSGQHGVHDHTPNTKSSHHHGFPSNHTPNIAGWSGMHRPFSTRIPARSALYVKQQTDVLAYNTRYRPVGSFIQPSDKVPRMPESATIDPETADWLTLDEDEEIVWSGKPPRE